jgi:hypothetical protein
MTNILAVVSALGATDISHTARQFTRSSCRVHRNAGDDDGGGGRGL